MNKVLLIGRLTRDPELRKTQSGQSFVRFSVAVNRNFKNAQGENEADFINCIAWRGTADTIARYLTKGSKIAVEGRIQTGSYDDASTGKKVYTTDVVCENFEFLDTRGAQNSGGFEQRDNFDPFEQAPMGQNFSNNNNNNNNKGGNSFDDEFSTDNTLDIASDDLPF